MKVATTTVFDILSRLRIRFQGDKALRFDFEEPIRSELYSSEQMDRHGGIVARSHKLLKIKTADRLLKRLDDNEKTLLEVRNVLSESIRSGKTVTPGAEWLLDNFYLIEEQVVNARKHLPKGYSEGLPCLSEGVSTGMPRVYDIVLEIISHSDGRVDVKSLSSFVAAYQESTILTLGELWAIPIMLRLAVIENLRRVCGKIALDMVDHNLADFWADKMIETVKEEPENLILAIADMARSKPVLVSPFVAGFTRKLQGKGPALALPLSWMEQQLSATGISSNDLVRQENQKQATDQVSVRNSIGTLRFLGATDWRDFVEALSSVEQILRQDTSGTYPLMDFATRDRYRHVVESISKSSALSETEVARKVIELTEKNTEPGQLSQKYSHVGYYLVDKGLSQTELAVNMNYSVGKKLIRIIRSVPVAIYLSSIALLSISMAAGLFYLAYSHGTYNKWVLSLVALLSVSGSAQLAVSLVNWFSTIWVRPKLLPRMDFSDGIPAACRTLVVIPTMISSRDYIEELVEALEIRFLANKEANLHFGLLTDFLDSETETKPEDQELLQFAKTRIEAVNDKYKSPQEDIFFLFHRPRTWNNTERKWMGYERKRGKLAALNTLLRGKGKEAFSLISGRFEVLMQVKYVITLDSDTQLPREAVWKFIAAMAHPLNQAIYDPAKKRVTEGYGILQPRLASAMPKKATSLYARLQGDVAGIDPYTRVSSDVYQDLFGEGSFIGKGIYDVDIFEQAVNHVFQENRILSHDLLEGCYTRSGLLSDVLLYEENPTQYGADVKRHHRWIRGDWQIGAWMLPFVTDSDGRLRFNKLSLLSRWKIFDNIRRSLLPLSLMLLLLMGWSLLPFPWLWTLAVTIIILLPVLTAAGWQLVNKPIDLTLKVHLVEVGTSVRDILLRFIFGIAVLPYEAYNYSDAVFHTNWRMIVTGKKLLEWTPSATVSQNAGTNIGQAYQTMWIAPFVSVLCIGFLGYNNPQALLVASPMLILWIFAPAIAWALSKPEKEESLELPADQILFLHKTARKTWTYFEQFVTEKENWLPPDNFQQEPVAVIAHRTSPTNLGLALLANLTAYDFGYIGGGELLSRSNNAVQSMLRLERYQGHFFNWYDTLTLLAMKPRYVSTVDSGNLVGHLLTLKQGLLSLPDEPVFSKKSYQGLRTTVAIICDFAKAENVHVLEKIVQVLDMAAVDNDSLLLVKDRIDELTALVVELRLGKGTNETNVYRWINNLSAQITSIQDDLDQLTPWLELLPVPNQFDELKQISLIPSLNQIQQLPGVLRDYIDAYEHDSDSENKTCLMQLRTHVEAAGKLAGERILLVEELAEHCEQLSTVEYDFLFDKSTSLLRIGYNVDEQRKDDSFYDLLASEARLGIFAGIAQGKLPQESWFALGRLLTNSGGDPILLSWSGSMFEYLMPQLVMPAYENTLLYQTNKATVKRQIDYAGSRGIPWGISESAYNMVDASMNYQYRAFGVPGLGLKRGLEEDLVIAPYASMLALMVSPAKASANLQLLAREGFEGEYGFYEAIDFTASRLPRGKTNSILYSFMVHHQGMGFLSLAYLLLNKPMQQRFVSELRFQATLLLLQERIPRATVFYAHTADLVETNRASTDVQVRSITTANTPIPEIQLLSNGRYRVMVTNSGGGYSRWKDIAVTRWREDTTRDDKGIFCYIKDLNSGKFWSNTHQPTLLPCEGYEAVFSLGHAEFARYDHGFFTKTDIVISPEDDTEMRRVRITNKTQYIRILQITSYAEIVLASQASDEAHASFSNLFVQTEIIPEYKAVICTRRARSKDELPPWMFHMMDIHGATSEEVSYETDRMEFIGRGKTLAHPQAMDVDKLSGNQGSVLDPIVAIRHRITIKPGQTATIDMIYGMGITKADCENLIHKYRDRHLKKRAFELSWTHSQVLLRQINVQEADAQLYDRMASSIIYHNPGLRADAAVISGNFRGQSGLWSHSISGDLPIVLLHIYDPESVDLVRQMVQAHAYWRLKGLAVDLVIWNEDYGSYRQVLQEQILGLISAETASVLYNTPGNIFVKSADQLSAEDRTLFESVSRIIIHDNKGSLSEQVNRHYQTNVLPPLLVVKPWILPLAQQSMILPDDLLYNNGTGGFTPDGKAYKMITDKQGTTPAPWVNVIANQDFGTVVSESGSAYSWAMNAHEYRLTPWSNDPVSDMGGEAFYIRDEETGSFWSPSSFPAIGTTPYITTHGFGYSTFEHREQGVFSEMHVSVDKESPVKFVAIKIKNESGRDRKLSVTGFLQMILGDVHSKTGMHIVSEQDVGSGALLIRNRYNTAFAERVTFFHVDGVNQSFTTDRSEFIGRNRNLKDPQAMYRKKLSNKTGAAMDPCAAIQVTIDVTDGEETEVIFRIGNAENSFAAQTLIRQFSDIDVVKNSVHDVKEYWDEVLGAVRITTPDNSLNILANGWLVYQTLACRVFARSGFYQSGGAFGFRDQLQDVLALLHTTPELARKQIILNASRQFTEGDVQHWWHPTEGRGVRTHCSDDLLWLPFVVSRYVKVTGDKAILNEEIGFLESRLLNPGEDSLYDLPMNSRQSGTLYFHCVRAIKHGLKLGVHGLPLIGSGDWNDGMDQVGNKGVGESVWLAFFLFDVLQRFEDVANLFGDAAFAQFCDQQATKIQKNIEANAWDGKWYKRAWFDDGAQLGSKENVECRIDAIAQSWSVLSGAADGERKITAMASLDEHLVKRELKLIQLLDPPFNGLGPNPGYIQGYVPGVRENGGQYSHAAIWALMGFAALGEREKVYELFQLINPLNHSSDAASAQIYKVEPYVMAADVYANESHQGRGGWTWYTGSAGWMYQFITGSFLGMERTADRLKLRPCFPADWPSVFIQYTFKSSVYHITVFQLNDIVDSWWQSGDERGMGDEIMLIDDGLEHHVSIYIGLVESSPAMQPERPVVV